MPGQGQETARDALDFAGMALALHLRGAWRWYASGAFATLLLAGIMMTLFRAPASFQPGYASVEQGQGLSAVASSLVADGVIDHPFIFKAAVYALGRENRIQAGEYLFKAPEGVMPVAWRVAFGETGVAAVRVTFPEGAASFDMARTLTDALPGFDGAAFLILAKPKEGMLFPDTYYFLPGTTPRAAVQRLTDTFAQKTADIAPAIAASGHSEEEILTMASLVEREAATPEDRRIVAGILWKRIANSMRLQVDAPFGYLHGSDSYQPTAADTESDSPYNTYRHDGLPPTPIANPGLDAIDAALHPTDTPYFYYLTGKDGKMHYAKTFDEHKANIAKYL